MALYEEQKAVEQLVRVGGEEAREGLGRWRERMRREWRMAGCSDGMRRSEAMSSKKDGR